MRRSHKPTVYERTRCDADRPTNRGKAKAIKRFPPFLRTFIGVLHSFRYRYRRQVSYEKGHWLLRKYWSYVWLGYYVFSFPAARCGNATGCTSMRYVFGFFPLISRLKIFHFIHFRGWHWLCVCSRTGCDACKPLNVASRTACRHRQCLCKSARG